MMGPLTIIQEQKSFTVQQGFPSVTIMQELKEIIIQGNIDMTNQFVPFSFNATQGQSLFGPLPAIPLAIWVYVTGVAQNQSNGDFTLSGANLILSQGVNSYDTVYGVIQIS